MSKRVAHLLKRHTERFIITNTILSPEQRQLLDDAGIRHNFPTNPKLVTKRSYPTKAQRRRANRIAKRYGLAAGTTWSVDCHVLVLAWLIMKQSSYRNLQGQNPADLITDELVHYPSYRDGYQERIRQFYITLPQVLTNDELSWFFLHMSNLLYRYSKETVADLTWHTYDIKNDFINLKGDQKFMQQWLLERLYAIQKNNNPKDIYKLFAVWQYVHQEFWW